MSGRPSRWLTALTIATYVILFAPIVVLIVFSFNSARRGFTWAGFTLDWYPKLFNNADMLGALRVTLEVAAIAVVGATILGSLLGLGLARLRFRGSGAAQTLLLLPIMTPEIIMGISLLVFFSQLFGLNGSIGQISSSRASVRHSRSRVPESRGRCWSISRRTFSPRRSILPSIAPLASLPPSEATTSASRPRPPPCLPRRGR